VPLKFEFPDSNLYLRFLRIYTSVYTIQQLSFEDQTKINNFELKWQKWAEEDDNYKNLGKSKCPLCSI
jgi:hypothetical protein